MPDTARISIFAWLCHVGDILRPLWKAVVTSTRLSGHIFISFDFLEILLEITLTLVG